MKNLLNKVKRETEENKWNVAQKSLEEFEKMMELIKQYPVKPTQPLILSPPYIPTKPDTIRYPFIN